MASAPSRSLRGVAGDHVVEVSLQIAMRRVGFDQRSGGLDCVGPMLFGQLEPALGGDTPAAGLDPHRWRAGRLARIFVLVLILASRAQRVPPRRKLGSACTVARSRRSPSAHLCAFKALIPSSQDFAAARGSLGEVSSSTGWASDTVRTENQRRKLRAKKERIERRVYPVRFVALKDGPQLALPIHIVEHPPQIHPLLVRRGFIERVHPRAGTQNHDRRRWRRSVRHGHLAAHEHVGKHRFDGKGKNDGNAGEKCRGSHETASAL